MMNPGGDQMSYSDMHSGLSHVVVSDQVKAMSSQLSFPALASGHAMTMHLSNMTYVDSGRQTTPEKVLYTMPLSYTTLEPSVSGLISSVGGEPHREGHQQHMEVEEEHIEGLLKLCSSMVPRTLGDAQITGSGSDQVHSEVVGEVRDQKDSGAVDLQLENEALRDQIQQLHEQIQKLSGNNPSADVSFDQPIVSVAASSSQISSLSDSTDMLASGNRIEGRESHDKELSVTPSEFEKVMTDLEMLKKSLKEKDETIDKMKKEALRKSEAIVKKDKELQTVKEKLKVVDLSECHAGDLGNASSDVGELDPVTAAALAELGDLMCEQCGVVYPSTDDLNEHMSTHHDQTIEKKQLRSSGKHYFSCGLCSKVFSSSKYLSDHKAKMHGLVCETNLNSPPAIEEEGETSDLINEALGNEGVTDGDALSDCAEMPREKTWSYKNAKYSCELCRKTFSTGSNLYKHQRNVHKIERAKKGVAYDVKPRCEECGREFDRLSAMYRHMKKVHNQESDAEDNTLENLTEPNESVLNDTGKEPSKGKTFECPKCRDIFSTISNLYRHKRNVHGIETSGKSRLDGSEEECIEAAKYTVYDDSGRRQYQCDMCPTVFTGVTNLFRHLRRHGGEKQFRCGQCGKKFAQKSSLTAHEKIHTGVKPHACDICGKTFLERKCLTYHLRNHTGDKPYKCDDCDASFVIKSKLERHKRQHCNDRPFQCDTCGKCFAQIFYLKQHERTHNGLRPFQCDLCQRRFSQRTNLARHMRTHTGEKPFQCENCGKNFATLYSLENHKRIHTGEKPFSCKECSLSFAERNSLKRHMRIHSGEKPYTCDVCGRAFSRRYDVKKHKRIHTGEKAYYCSVCGNGFNQKSDLEKHAKTHVTQREACSKDSFRPPAPYEYSFDNVNATQPLVSSSTVTHPVVHATNTTVSNALPSNLVLPPHLPPTALSNMLPTNQTSHQTILQTLHPPPAGHYSYPMQTLQQHGPESTPWLTMTFQHLHDGHS